MEFKKKDIDEIIDTNGDLIGTDAIPKNGSDLEGAANGTTDMNAKKGQQPFRYDMLGRFGFTLMPFMEGVDKNRGQAELENDLVDLMNERYVDLLAHYYRNPEDVKTDYREYSKEKEVSEDAMKYSVEWAEKVLKVIEEHFGKAFKELNEGLQTLDEQFQENLVEAKVAEDRMVKKVEDEMTNKSEDKDVTDKKLKKIAGLINKLEDGDKNKLINLLEIDG